MDVDVEGHAAMTLKKFFAVDCNQCAQRLSENLCASAEDARRLAHDAGWKRFAKRTPGGGRDGRDLCPRCWAREQMPPLKDPSSEVENGHQIGAAARAVEG